jgi:hypothetical protein
MDIFERNAIRAEAGLPLLSVEAETRKLALVQERAEFESYFERERHRFSDLWVGRTGFLTRMGMWSIARKQLRDEWQKNRATN